MIYQANSNDLQTEAVIEVTNEAGKVTEVDKISGFSMVFDILNLGDAFSLTVPDPYNKWRDVLVPKLPIRVYLSNPAVSGNSNVLMYDGLIVKRKIQGDLSKGTIIQVECSDKGWYLKNNCPRVYESLQKGNYIDLIKKYAGDPSWGFITNLGGIQVAKVRTDGETSKLIRQGLIQGRAAAVAAQADQLVIYRIQVEPGMTASSILIRYAQNFGRLVNVTPDGYLQIFTPNYTQQPSYKIEYHDNNNQRVQNNILSVEIDESIETVYSKVTVVGEVVGWKPLDPNDPNPGKFQGYSENKGLLPFTHELTYTEGELYQPKYANAAADWRNKRGLFDSFTAVYRLRGHQQNGKFWTSDTMVAVNDTVNNIVGNFYVSLVRLERTEQGDITEVYVKKPNVLQPYFK